MRRFLATFLLVFMSPLSVLAAAPSILGTPVFNQFTTAATTWTQAVTVSTSGQNRCLVVVVNHNGSNTTQSGVTADGVAMVHIYDQAGAIELRGSVWYLANPHTGTINVIASTASQANLFMTSFVLQDCLQTSASVLDISGTATAGSGTSASKAVTTSVDSDFMIVWGGFLPATSAFVPGGTQSSFGTGATASGNIAVSWDTKATAGSYTGSYSWTSSSDYDLYVVGLKYVAPTATSIADTRICLNGICFDQ